MRVADVAPPVLPAGDRPGPDTPMGQWPADLYIALEMVTYGTLQWDAAPAEVWDAEGTWDELGGELVEYVDATCTFHGLELDTGEPDAEGRFTSAGARLTLDNRDGRWSRYAPGGASVFFPPGRRLLVWAELAGEPWWLYAGRVTAWADVAGRVDLEAADGLSELNVRIGEWSAGVAGQLPADRLAAIAALAGWGGPVRFDAGDVGLLARPTSSSPLEEMQTVAESDGGVLYVDADGTLLYRDRRWVAGRTDQTAVPVVSSNVCDAPVIVWDLVLTTDDGMLVNLAHLANLAVPPLEVTGEDVVSRDRYGSYTLPQNRDTDLWTTLGEGQALADYIVALRGDPSTRIGSCTLHVHDPQQDLWATAIDLRRGDVLELLEDLPAQDGSTFRADVLVIVSAIRHQITPTSWVCSIGTSRTVGNRLTLEWDTSLYTWDDPNPDNVWSH